ncbi:MAG: hypothetical protein B9S28_02045 [Opitutia bacterium Tous-C10FEB]|nr:MAG: hypothetical protein B9S28_02045 [Opitutae bacterium Tous-C10FEB]
MNSCLYECQILHQRFTPKAHRFVYRIFMFAIDLDEIAALPKRLALFSNQRRNVYNFCERDFLPTTEIIHQPTPPGPAPAPSAGLKDRVIAHLAAHGIDLAGGRVMLITLPRVFGYQFNPVSFYFCYDQQGRPVASIAEVSNTFKEMKPFVLGPATSATTANAAVFSRRTPKYFYVSPFSDLDVAFDFTLHTPGDKLAIQIDDYAAGERTLTSVLTGSRTSLTNGRLAWFTFKYPFITLRVMALIHWQALQLYLKRVPWFAKSARPEAQRDLYRPHSSIAPPAA